MANFNKAVDAYDKMVSTGKLGKFTPAEANELYFDLNDITYKGVFCTISKAVADWFKRYGFTVKEEGIGWKVSK